MIYLESQDMYILATYQGAPKICFHCCLAGHVRKDCPELAVLQCYQRKGFGHQRRHCRKQRTENDFVRKLPHPDETYQQEESSPIEANMIEVEVETNIFHNHEESEPQKPFFFFCMVYLTFIFGEAHRQ
jgi:hypothetical protein